MSGIRDGEVSKCIVYALLSPTFGMHQYTADLANRMAASGHEVSLVTTTLLPRDRYGPQVAIHTPISMSGTGLSAQSLDRGQYMAAAEAIVGQDPDVVHFTGPHLWNPILMRRLQRKGIPVVHTVHDLDPHHGRRFGALLRPWNGAVIRSADRILVHGRVYETRLVEAGVPADRVCVTPLLHSFLSQETLARLDMQGADGLDVSYEPLMLFFGRLEAYKGVEYLLTAFAQIANESAAEWKLLLAGPGNLSTVWTGELPMRVELRDRLIDDPEALDLFRRCSIVVLPYIDATQSALIAAAYYFQKPVLVSRSGALPEYVQEDETGFIVEPGHPATLARALDEVIGDPERLRQMGQAGRQWYDGQRKLEEESLQSLYEAF